MVRENGSKINRMAQHIQAVAEPSSQSYGELPEGVVFPLEKVDDVRNLEGLLGDPVTRKRIVRTFCMVNQGVRVFLLLSCGKSHFNTPSSTLIRATWTLVTIKINN